MNDLLTFSPPDVWVKTVLCYEHGGSLYDFNSDLNDTGHMVTSAMPEGAVARAGTNER